MKCTHCAVEISWNPTTLTWVDSKSNIAQQYCWIDPQLGSELHAPPVGSEVPLTPLQVAVSTLRAIASYPTRSTDAAVMTMQRMATEALQRLS